MARPQQRRSVQRGLVQPANFRPLTDIGWTAEAVSPGVIDIILSPGAPPMTVYAVPRLHHDLSGLYPVTCVPAGPNFRCTYALPVTFPSYISLASADPGIRSEVGNFLVGQYSYMGTAGAPPTALPVVTATYVSHSGADLVLSTGLTAFDTLLVNLGGWANVTSGGTGSSLTSDVATLTVSGAWSLSTGDHIVYEDTGLASSLITTHCLGPVTIVIP